MLGGDVSLASACAACTRACGLVGSELVGSLTNGQGEEGKANNHPQVSYQR